MTRAEVAAWLLCALQVSALVTAAHLRQDVPRAATPARAGWQAAPALVPEAAPAGSTQTAMVLIPRGSYQPFFKRERAAPPTVTASFLLDSLPVSRSAYLDFVVRHPEW